MPSPEEISKIQEFQDKIVNLVNEYESKGVRTSIALHVIVMNALIIDMACCGGFPTEKQFLYQAGLVYQRAANSRPALEAIAESKRQAEAKEKN